jgi:anaerobic C4-dicarboxylate transporter DcuA
MIWFEFLFVLLLILIGARMRGMGLGIAGGVGMLILVFFFHLKPVSPPIDVMLIILAVITAAATLQAAGGLDILVNWAAYILRQNPKRITLLAPLVTYFFTLFAGTAHVNYSVLPVIAEVALRQRIRPERPLSISVIASHLAITGSPVGAATAALTVMLSPSGLDLIDILKVCIPSGIIGTLLGTIAAGMMGKNLEKDPVFLQKMNDPEFVEELETDTTVKIKSKKRGGYLALAVFFAAVSVIIFFGAFPQFRPIFESEGKAEPMRTAEIIEIIMLSAAAFMLVLSRTKATEPVKTPIFKAGSEAIVSIFGVVWMSDTFLKGNELFFKENLGAMVQAYPWTFAIALFVFSALVFSQTAAIRALVPLGLSIGIAPVQLLAMFPAANGDFFIPGYPTLLAAIGFDRSGSTKIGKYLFNHSFMWPGLVGVGGAVVAGLVIVNIFY